MITCNYIIIFKFLLYLLCVCVSVMEYLWELIPFTKWIPEMDLRFSGMVVHAFSFSTQEAEPGGYL